MIRFSDNSRVGTIKRVTSLFLRGTTGCYGSVTTPSPSLKRRGGYKNIKLLFPTKELSTDNSIMIGIAGYLNYIKNKNLPAGKAGKIPRPESIKATGNLKL